MPLPIVEHVTELKSETTTLFTRHKRLILTAIIVSIPFILLGIWATRVRESLIASLNAIHKDASTVVAPTITPILVSSPSAYTDILGTSNEDTITPEPQDITYPTPTPYPIITQIPTPTPYQVAATTFTSTPTCTGQPTVDNSQVYVSPTTTTVGGTASIEVDLQDCNNVIAPVSDQLSVVLSSGDAGTKINGAPSPVNLETKNGKVTFSVTSSTATTATFIITDKTRSFTVTTPGYHNPSVTFSNNTSGNSHCTTASGVPNFWYSDVSPSGQQTTTAGSTVSYQVVIKDCNQNPAPVSDTLKISLTSGDPSTQVNGNNLPVTITTSNGQANFTVLSQIAQTVHLTVTDITSGFDVTDANNRPPSIVFTGNNTATPTPTPIPGPTATPTPVPSPTGTATSSGTTP